MALWPDNRSRQGHNAAGRTPAYLIMARVPGKPPGAADRDRLYAEMRNLARVLWVRERCIPPTVADLWSYCGTTVATRLASQAIRRVAKITPEPLRYAPTPREARRLARGQADGGPG
jgi:uncharacterized protein (DUF2236 family)